ncbi:MAG: type II toxin-antitoxin system VapB family antitoxin [Bauldia sp.]
MTKQLNIRSDEAYEIASRVSREIGRTRADVVLAALLSFAEARIDRKMTRKQRAFVNELMALARRSAAVAPRGMTSDHSYLYDDKGLPR